MLGSVAEEGDDWVCELFQDDHMRFLQEQLQQPDYQEALCSLPSPLYPSQNLGKIKSVQQMFSLWHPPTHNPPVCSFKYPAVLYFDNNNDNNSGHFL